MKQTRLTHRLVDFIPEHLEEGLLYISDQYGTVAHKCCCGCGEEVITPLGPTDWSIYVEADGATLHPSVGNWSYGCRSHYWIRRGRVIWAGDMSQRDIERGRAMDSAAKRVYFRSVNSDKFRHALLQAIKPGALLTKLCAAFKRWWSSNS